MFYSRIKNMISNRSTIRLFTCVKIIALIIAIALVITKCVTNCVTQIFQF